MTPSGEESGYFPSSAGGTHATAFTPTNNEWPTLHSQFDLTPLVVADAPVGLTMFFLCGEGAPVDVICVTLVRKAAKNKKAELQIRLCATKHTTSTRSTLCDPVLEAMEPRFKYVRDFLEHHLTREFVVTFMPHAILTSANKLDTTGGATSSSSHQPRVISGPSLTGGFPGGTQPETSAAKNSPLISTHGC